MTKSGSASTNVAYIVMGVCGVGKTSVSKDLARRLGARYVEADDFHSQTNLDALKSGVPLTDSMRVPWLVSLSKAAESARQHSDVVVACSALKRKYRDIIGAHVGNKRIIYLSGDRNLIAKRLASRKNHFMSAALLDSQLETLEEPTVGENALKIDIAGNRDDVLKQILTALGIHQEHS